MENQARMRNRWLKVAQGKASHGSVVDAHTGTIASHIGWCGKTKKKAKLEMQYLCIDQTTPRRHIL